jgi:hypothetical protein
MPIDAETAQKISIGRAGSEERRRYVEAFNRQYHPCETGLHVCGIDDDAGLLCGPHFTVLNLLFSVDAVQAAFDAAKQSFSCGDDGDVLVDLMIDGEAIDDFWMRRQMVEVMQREIGNAE